MSDEPSIEGFPPIADGRAKVLVLGSMPSIVSLDKQQYYGHQRNAFWPIMMTLFEGAMDADYQRRKRILIDHRLAVWDVLKTCRRQGSLDSNIDENSIETNDFSTFYQQHSALKQVFFNGGMAEKMYKKYVLPILGDKCAYLSYRRLPSTSPAHASLSFEQKCDAWRVILKFTEDNSTPMLAAVDKT